MNALHDNSQGMVPLIDYDHRLEDFESAVISGLSGSPKRLPCKFFYDERGSRLFDRICDLDAYYPTRTEIGLLRDNAEHISRLIGPGAHLIELGSGASVKIRVLLDAMPDLAQYTAVDISRKFLVESAEALARDYPDLSVLAVCADFTRTFEVPDPGHRPGAQRVAFFPGSTIGNFRPDEALVLLRRIRTLLGSDGGLLIGTDLKKNPDTLYAAYNDTDGITAAFNLNLLNRINAELDGSFDIDGFDHHAPYLEKDGKIEMRLISKRDQSASVGRREFFFKAGEYIHTENSYKFTVQQFRKLCARAGFAFRTCWTDPDDLFGVHYLETCGPKGAGGP